MSIDTGYIDIPGSPMWYAFLINAVNDTKCYLCLLALADIYRYFQGALCGMHF